jgi:hypothetical protein
MAGPGETLGSPWPPIAIRLWEKPIMQDVPLKRGNINSVYAPFPMTMAHHRRKAWGVLNGRRRPQVARLVGGPP